jgi:hypothetical protein
MHKTEIVEVANGVYRWECSQGCVMVLASASRNAVERQAHAHEAGFNAQA